MFWIWIWSYSNWFSFLRCSVVTWLSLICWSLVRCLLFRLIKSGRYISSCCWFSCPRIASFLTASILIYSQRRPSLSWLVKSTRHIWVRRFRQWFLSRFNFTILPILISSFYTANFWLRASRTLRCMPIEITLWSILHIIWKFFW